MGRLSIVAGLVLGILAAVLLLGGIVVLVPDDPAAPSPTPLVATTPATSGSPSSSAPAEPSAVASASPGASAGVSVGGAPSDNGVSAPTLAVPEGSIVPGVTGTP
jgi:hypothetical protein